MKRFKFRVRRADEVEIEVSARDEDRARMLIDGSAIGSTRDRGEKIESYKSLPGTITYSFITSVSPQKGETE